jgi:hypothetical protein
MYSLHASAHGRGPSEVTEYKNADKGRHYWKKGPSFEMFEFIFAYLAD